MLITLSAYLLDNYKGSSGDRAQRKPHIIGRVLQQRYNQHFPQALFISSVITLTIEVNLRILVSE